MLMQLAHAYYLQITNTFLEVFLANETILLFLGGGVYNRELRSLNEL